MCCCLDGDREKNPASLRSGLRTLVAWALPVTTLALIPKCPACVAAYVLLFTGVGLSLSTATLLRGGLIAISLTALAYLVFRTTRRALSSTS
jgi:hypothetical protein